MLLAYNNHYSSALISKRHSFAQFDSKILAISQIIIIALAGISVSYWLFLFSNNIILNYRMASLRSTVVQTGQEIGSLQESVSNLVDNDELKAWAQMNNFVPVNQLGYLNLAQNDLARLDQYSF